MIKNTRKVISPFVYALFVFCLFLGFTADYCLSNATEIYGDEEMPSSKWEWDEDGSSIRIFINDQDVTEAEFPPDTKYLESRHFIKRVVIEPGITNIPDEAFKGCDVLEEVEIPDTVREIGTRAFSSCTSLSSIIIPDSVTRINNNAFSNCTNLCTISLPQSLTSFSDFMFSGCTSLEEIEISDAVTHIGGYAFQNCDSLLEITFPESIETFGINVLKDCDNLQILNYNSWQASGDKEKYLVNKCPNLTTIHYGDKVRSIPEHFLYECGITDLNIPEHITGIGSRAFCRCDGLKEVTIPENILEIGKSAIIKCNSLEQLNLHTNLAADREKDTYILNECENLSRITYGENITKIPDYFLFSCGLSDFEIPDTVTEIGKYALSNCNKVEKVSIPDHVTKIGDHTFHECNGLKEITIPENLLDIGSSAICRCNALEQLNLNANITAKREEKASILKECNSIFKINYGEKVTKIPDYFIDSCGIKEISIPDTITEIGTYAFFRCDDLEKITIPVSVTKINGYIISECSGITSLIYNPINAENQEEKTAIKDCPKLEKIIFGKQVEKIPDRFIENCGITVIGGKNDLLNVQMIGDYAFRNCDAFTDIWLSESVRLGKYSFQDCPILNVHGYNYFGKDTNDAYAMQKNYGYEFKPIADHTWGAPKTYKSIIVHKCTVCGIEKYDFAKKSTAAAGYCDSKGVICSYNKNKKKMDISNSSKEDSIIRILYNKSIELNSSEAEIKSCIPKNSKYLKAERISGQRYTLKAGKVTTDTKLEVKFLIDGKVFSQTFSVRIRKSGNIKDKKSGTIRLKISKKNYRCKVKCHKGKLNFKSAKKKIATISKSGKIKPKKIGKTKITVFTKENDTYFEDQMRFTLKVIK